MVEATNIVSVGDGFRGNLQMPSNMFCLISSSSSATPFSVTMIGIPKPDTISKVRLILSVHWISEIGAFLPWTNKRVNLDLCWHEGGSKEMGVIIDSNEIAASLEPIDCNTSNSEGGLKRPVFRPRIQQRLNIPSRSFAWNRCNGFQARYGSKMLMFLTRPIIDLGPFFFPFSVR